MSNIFQKAFKIVLNFDKTYFNCSLSSIGYTDIIFIYHDNDATQKYNEAYKSHILYPLELYFNNMGLSCSNVMSPFSKKNISLSENKYYSYNLISLISKVFRLPFEVIGFKYVSDIIKKYTIYFYWLIILKKIRPMLVIGIQPECGICMAANKLRIVVADYQHGVISREHPVYSKANFLLCKRYEVPSLFIVWNNYFQSLLRDAIGDSSEISILNLGKPILPYDSMHDEGLQNLISITDNYSCIILLSLQPDLDTIRDDIEFNGLLLDSIVDSIKMTRDKDVFWLIRFHPSQLSGDAYTKTERKLIELLGNPINYEYKISSYLPLECLFNYCDLHVTDYSSVVIEASLNGVKSAILNEFIGPGKKFESYFSHEIKTKSAYLIDGDAQSLLNWISLNSMRDKKIKFQNFNVKPLLDLIKNRL